MPKHKPIYFEDPSITQEIKDRVKKYIANHPVASSTKNAVIATAIVGGVLTIGAIAPGALWFVGKSLLEARREKQERYRKLWINFHSLKKRGAFEFVKKAPDGGLIYRFTKDGHMMTRNFLLETLKIPSPKKWDGQWRIVVFDIPEKYKKARYALWSKLRELGFYPLQKSVWIYPFPCENEIQFIKSIFNIEPFVEIFTVVGMANGSVIYHFKSLLKKCA